MTCYSATTRNYSNVYVFLHCTVKREVVVSSTGGTDKNSPVIAVRILSAPACSAALLAASEQMQLPRCHRHAHGLRPGLPLAIVELERRQQRAVQRRAVG
jgi:hypothetical protein